MKSLSVHAHAKVNLYLGVLGVREDGYHELETLFQAITLFDELVIQESSGKSTFEVSGHPRLETDDNLVLRAQRWIESQIRERLPVSIRLTKNIPEAAGLGGGSSDAAAALLGIRDLFDLELTDDDLSRGALSLGADVPFFLNGGTAVGEGIGERLTPVTLPYAYSLILINPGFPVSTPLVFREFSKGLTDRPRKGKLWKLLGLHHGLEDLMHNDLQSTCERLYPEVEEARKVLGSLGLRKTLMTGSGPTIFGPSDTDVTTIVRGCLNQSWKVFFSEPAQKGVVIH